MSAEFKIHGVGWGHPPAKRGECGFHFFDGHGRSLCGVHTGFRGAVQEDDGSPIRRGDCTACYGKFPAWAGQRWAELKGLTAKPERICGMCGRRRDVYDVGGFELCGACVWVSSGDASIYPSTPAARVEEIPQTELGEGICDGCGEHKPKLWSCDGAPLVGGAICSDCKGEGGQSK